MFSLICKQYYFFVYLLFFPYETAFLCCFGDCSGPNSVDQAVIELTGLYLPPLCCSLFGRKVSSLGQKEQAPLQRLTQFMTHCSLRNFPWSFRDLDSNKTRSLVSTQNNFRTGKKNWYVLKTYTQRKNKHTNSVSVNFSRV